MTNPIDIIDHCAGLRPTDTLYALRRERIKIVEATEGSYNAMFDEAVQGVSVLERLLVAQHACELGGATSLFTHYTKRLEALKGDRATKRVTALLGFTKKLIIKPIEGDRIAVQALQNVGLDAPAIVAVGQLIAFLSYQIRLVAGLQAMQVAGENKAAVIAPPDITGTTIPSPLRVKGFTNEVLNWQSWIEPLDLAVATPEQLAAIEAMSPTAKNQAYFKMLAHQPEMLLQRSIAFNAIMFAPGGMPRSERELGATVESRLNGCVYCASVHAQRFEQLAKRNDVIAQLFEDPASAGTTPRERCIVQLSGVIGLTPQLFAASHVKQAREAGLSDAELLDLIHAVALFAWANRLMLNLGEPYYQDGTLAEKGQV